MTDLFAELFERETKVAGTCIETEFGFIGETLGFFTAQQTGYVGSDNHFYEETPTHQRIKIRSVLFFADNNEYAGKDTIKETITEL